MHYSPLTPSPFRHHPRRHTHRSHLTLSKQNTFTAATAARAAQELPRPARKPHEPNSPPLARQMVNYIHSRIFRWDRVSDNEPVLFD